MDGVIKDIQFGYVTVDQNGLIKVIHVGESFGKTETLTDIPADQIEQEQSQEETDEEDSSMSEESDILKKLMERRQSELGT
jgi:flagellar biogenesis protein FliO